MRVVGERKMKQNSLGGEIDRLGVGIDLVFGDDQLEAGDGGGVAGVQIAVVREVGMEGDREQAAFVVDVHFFGQVEVGLGPEFPVFADAHLAGLLDDVRRGRVVVREIQRLVEPGQHRLKRDLRQLILGEAENRQAHQGDGEAEQFHCEPFGSANPIERIDMIANGRVCVEMRRIFLAAVPKARDWILNFRFEISD
jgi:hypothetical protein